MRKHWAVLLLDRALERTDARYHEYGSAGVTACGRTWFIKGYGMRTRLEEATAVWVHRKSAEKFAEPCKRCQAKLNGKSA